MKKIGSAILALGASAALLLSGCAGGTRGASPANSPSTSATGSTEATNPAPSSSESSSAAEGTITLGSGFDAGAKIGVSLPQKTSENWVLGEALFTDQLKTAGYDPIVQFANGGVSEQQNQISAMIEQGVKVLVIGAIDGSQLNGQLEAAKAAGIPVIAYDRLLMNTNDVDIYISFDNYKVGVLQGTALLEGLEKSGKASPWNIELISGSPDDSNSKPFFEGGMSVLQPKIDDGTLKVPSGQVTQQQTATAGWKGENAQKRMDAILSANYQGDVPLDGILSPNDTLARAALTAVKSAGKANPVITGQDSEVESIKLIVEGTQYSTINKDTKTIVTKVVEYIGQIQKGQPVEVNDTMSYNNGVKVVPSYLLTPVIVTKDNVCTAYAPDTAAGKEAAKDCAK
ncbi:MAG: sugar-binding protein [Propionicimonas sp.]|uniref:sugar-binding protein n=1 Tax=Propionicimonas sp. TaxID=1955623 RepID=UPI002B20321A|nr:sugar-binding protein [Propionicimonas sp.]MEA4942898.1 sugar-binding protein [Propionicimonas sp.]